MEEGDERIINSFLPELARPWVCDMKVGRWAVPGTSVGTKKKDGSNLLIDLCQGDNGTEAPVYSGTSRELCWPRGSSNLDEGFEVVAKPANNTEFGR